MLHNFIGGADGSKPFAPVTIGPAGSLFGATPSGGANNKGVVYKLDSSGNETVLYAFTGQADGGEPQSGVIADSAGNLYGTAGLGGASNNGVVYKLDASGQETVLYAFQNKKDGESPLGGVILDKAGNLYGTTSFGSMNAGTAFKLSPAGKLGVLHAFTGGGDGANPEAGLILGKAGNLYGTTTAGGDAGTVFEIKK